MQHIHVNNAPSFPSRWLQASLFVFSSLPSVSVHQLIQIGRREGGGKEEEKKSESEDTEEDQIVNLFSLRHFGYLLHLLLSFNSLLLLTLRLPLCLELLALLLFLGLRRSSTRRMSTKR